MKKGIIIALILAISLFIFAGDKMEILEALKLKKITETLSLDKKQIAEYMIMEEDLRELNDSIARLTENLVNEAKLSIKNGRYEKAENILKWFSNMEQLSIDESLKIRKDFVDSLNDEQKLKYFIFEHEFRKQLKKNILLNKLHKEDK